LGTWAKGLVHLAFEVGKIFGPEANVKEDKDVNALHPKVPEKFAKFPGIQSVHIETADLEVTNRSPVPSSV